MTIPTVVGDTPQVVAAYVATADIDYATEIPATTKMLTPSEISSISGGLNGSGTVRVVGAAPFAAGDVLVAGIGPNTPDGLLAKVTAVSGQGSAQVLETVPATLQQAVAHGRLSTVTSFTQAGSGFGAGTVTQSPGPRASSASFRFSGSRAAAQSGGSGVTVPIRASVACGTGGITVTGTAQASISATYSAAWSNAGLAMSGAATAAESIDLTATAQPGTCTLAPTAISPSFQGPAETVLIGDLPVVVHPELTFTLQGEVSTTEPITASAGQTLTGTAGVTFLHGTPIPFGGARNSTRFQTPTPGNAAGTLALSVGPELTLGLYGGTGPVFTYHAGLELDVQPQTNPWWNLYATITAGAKLTVPLLGTTLGSERAFDARFLLAHAPLPAPPVTSGNARVTFPEATAGGNAGPVLGPDGRLWFVGANDDQRDSLVAIDSATGAVRYYPLPATVGAATADGAPSAAYDDALAFDGAGNAWLGAAAIEQLTDTQQRSSSVLMRYTPSTGEYQSFALPADCPAGSPGWLGLTSASDGAIWLECADGGSVSVLARVTDDGTITRAATSSGLIQVAGAPTPGSGGSIWMQAGEPGSGSVGVARYSPSGTLTYYPNSAATTFQGQLATVVGNTAGQVVEMTACSGYASGTTSYCFYDIGANGQRTKFGFITGINPLYNAHTNEPSLDTQGNVWIVLDRPTDTGTQQVLYEVPQTGTTAALTLHYPPDTTPNGALPQFAPVRTPDGAVWTFLQLDPGALTVARISTTG